MSSLASSLVRSSAANEQRRTHGQQVLRCRPAGVDHRQAPPRGAGQPFVLLEGVKFPDLLDDTTFRYRWCEDRVEDMGNGHRGPWCTRPRGHQGRHHAAHGTVYAVWGVRA